MIYYFVILIYLSFIIDFFVWPIPSEASTFQLVKNDKINGIHKTLLISIFLLSLISYLTPLVLSVVNLVKPTIEQFNSADLMGILIAGLGRIITIKSALVLKNHYKCELVSGSIYKWSRNPITMGMHLTFIGMLVIFPYWFLLVGMTIDLINIHYKILIEEKSLLKKYGDNYLNYSKSTPRYIFL